MRSDTTSRGARPSINDTALRLFGRERTIGLAKFFVKLHRLRLEPVGDFLSAPALGPRQADLGRHVEDERQVGHCRPHGHPFKAADQALVDVSERPLIDACRIDKAVADHPGAGLNRRQDDISHMVVAGGGEQDRLGLGAERFRDSRQQDVP